MEDNCLLISGQRARVGVPGATKYGLKKERIEEIEESFRSKKENQEKKTIPDKPYLRVKRDPILLIYLIKIDSQDSNGKKKSNKEAMELVGNIPIVALGLGFPGDYEGARSESTKVKYVLNRISSRDREDMLNFEEDTEDEDE